MASLVLIQEAISVARVGLYSDGSEFDAKRAQVAILAGTAMVVGSSDTNAKNPTSAAEAAKFLGVATYLMSLEPNVTGTTEYAIGDMVNFVKRGDIWVAVEVAVAVGDPAFIRYTANGGNTQLGAFRNDADTARAFQIPGAMFITGQATPAGLALLRFSAF